MDRADLFSGFEAGVNEMWTRTLVSCGGKSLEERPVSEDAQAEWPCCANICHFNRCVSMQFISRKAREEDRTDVVDAKGGCRDRR